MSKNKNNINPLIFNKKINNVNKIIPLKKSAVLVGTTRHFPPSSREWNSSIYSYNNNNISNLSILDKNLNNIIKSYFNMYLRTNITKSKYIPTRYRRQNLEKIFVSKAELKHTNTKVIITLYVYNVEKKLLTSKLTNILNNLYSNKNRKVTFSNNMYYASLLEHNINNYKYIKENLSFKSYLDNLYYSICENIINETDIFSMTDIKEYNEDNNIVKDINYYMSIKTIDDYIQKKRIYEHSIFYYYNEITIKEFSNYKLLLDFNKAKFENSLLSKFNLIIKNMYNKEVEFNIINLKSVVLNSDIFTEAIVMRLKDRKNKLITVLNSSLSIIKLPYFFRIKYNYKNIILRDLLINKVNRLHLDLILNKSNDFTLNKLLYNLFPKPIEKTSIKTSTNKIINKDNYSNVINNSIENITLDSIKYKDIYGGRIEAKGRLSKRFTASRSIFKMKWKGSLKNIDASYRGLSSVILRGNLKPNLQYSLINSKSRNGSFGIKGWISSK